MATLTSTKIKNTYDSLLKTSDNDNITSSAKQITDGLGNSTPLYISTTQVGIGVTPDATYDLHVYSDAKVGGNLTVTGDLTVEGTTTTVDTDTLRVEDPLIELARLNTSSDAIDIGFYGKYTPSATTLYTGLFRDTGDGKYKLFKSLQEEPTTTVNTSGTGFDYADLVVGNLETQDGATFGGIVVCDFGIQGDLTGDLTGDVIVNQYISHAEDLDTRINFTTNNIAFETNGSRAILIGSSQNVTFDGKLRASDGTSTAPAYSFSNDTNTGMYRTGSDVLNLGVGGSDAITMFTGNVYIKTGGTTKLTVGSSSTTVADELIVSGTGQSSFAGQVTIPETPVADTDAASKGYVDDKFEETDTLAEVLALGNTTGGTDIDVSSGDDITFADSSSAYFGNDNDLRIYHVNGGDSIISKTSTGEGDLIIQNAITDADVVFRSDNGSGGVTAYIRLDGSAENIAFSKDTKHADGIEAIFGGGNDLKIYHTADTGSYVQNTKAIPLIIDQDGAQDLEIKSNRSVDIFIDKNNDDTTTSFKILSNTETFNSSNVVFEVTQTGAVIADASLTLGGAIDQNGGNNNFTGSLYVENTAPVLRLTENDATNTPAWWVVGDGGNFSIRLNNTGNYPMTILTNATNDAVTSIQFKYDLDINADIDIAGDILPTTDSTYDLGSTSLRWANVWADNINGGTIVNGSGTANDVAMWSDSDTLTDAPIAISGNDATFAGDVTVNGGDLTITSASTNSVINLNGGDSFVEKDSGTDLYIANNVSDRDIKFRVKDNGTNVIALTLDGSENGNATFAGSVTADTLTLTSGNDDLTFTQSGDDWTINNAQQNNSITIFDGTAGVGINYNGTEYLKVSTSGVYVTDNIDFFVDTNLLFVDATDNLVGIGKTPSTYKLDVNGKIASNNYIIAGLGNGGVALTHNDGEGNANVTFNHVSGIPEQNGNSFRITANTDSSTGANMKFQIAEGVTSGVSVSATEVFRLEPDGPKVRKSSGGVLTLQRDDASIVDGNPIGRLRFSGDDPTNDVFNMGAEIRGEAAGTWDTDNYPTELQFYTTTTDTQSIALKLESDQDAVFYSNVTLSDGSLIITQSTGTETFKVTTAYDRVGKFVSSDANAFLAIQDSNSTDNGVGINVAGDQLKLLTANSTGLTVESDQQIKLNAYGSGTYTGTATYRLAVDSTGDVIEIPIGGGPVDGSGTANYLTMWTDSDTIGNGPASYSSGSALTTFSSDLKITNSTPYLYLYDNGNGGGGGAEAQIIFQNTSGNAMGIGYTADETTNSDLIISTDAGSTYGGYLGLSASAITDAQADIILDPKSKVHVTKNIDIYKYTDTSASATGSTLLTLSNNVGTESVAGDLQQQKTFIDFSLYDSNTNEVPQVRIGAEVGENGNADSQEKEGSGAFVVYTNNATGVGPSPTGLSERLRVDYQGRVGFGTSAPNHNLQVEGGSSESIINLTTTGYSNGLDIIEGTDGHAAIWLRENSYMHFATNNTERMRISATGDVGIGTDDPSDALEIYGSQKGIKITNTAENAAGILWVDSADSGQQASIKYDSGDNKLKFYNSTSERMSLLSNGDLTINNSLSLFGYGDPTGVLCFADHPVGSTLSTDESDYHIVFKNSGLSTTGDFEYTLAWQDVNGGVVSAIGLVDEGASGASGLYFATGNTTSISNKFTITSNAEGHIELEGDAPVFKAICNNGNSGLRVNVTGLDANSDDLFRVQDDGATKFELDRDGKMYVQSYIYHSGDTNTYMLFTGDRIRFKAGNVDFIDMYEGANDYIVFNEAGANVDFRVESDSIAHMFFVDGGTNRIGINSSSPTGLLHIEQHQTDNSPFKVAGISGSTVENILTYGINAAATSWYHLVGQSSGGTTNNVIIYGNGNIQNANNSYGQISDETLKENIADATPKLDELMDVEIKNFNFIGDDTKQIGVIAQQVEEIFPNMVFESEDPITKESKKGVKYSVFVPMLIKAMQEQQEIINDLKTRIETLENS